MTASRGLESAMISAFCSSRPARRGARQELRKAAVAKRVDPILAVRDRLARLENRRAQTQFDPVPVEQRGQRNRRRTQLEWRRRARVHELAQERLENRPVLAVGAQVHGAYLGRMRHHAPKNQPHVEQLRIEDLRSERSSKEITQALARRNRFVFRLAADRLEQGQRESFVCLRDEARLARKMM